MTETHLRSRVALEEPAPARSSCASSASNSTSLRLREGAGPRSATSSKARSTASRRCHYVERIARTKATIGWQRMLARGLPPRPVLGADTEVVLDGAIFGKPEDDADAAAHARRGSSGRTHQVLTAVALRWQDDTAVEISTSAVTFRALSPTRSTRYVATRRAVRQGRRRTRSRAAPRVRQRIEGSYSGVMGLPLYETAELLAGSASAVL